MTCDLNTVRDIAKYDSQTDMTTVVNHLVYDAFGKVTSESYPAVDSLFLFTARPFDEDARLQNNLNRWYDARVGRWLSEDPIGFAAGDGNVYRYLGNGPVRQMDHNGLFPIVCTCEAMDMIGGGYFFSFDVDADWTNGDVYSMCGSACHIDPHRLGRPITGTPAQPGVHQYNVLVVGSKG